MAKSNPKKQTSKPDKNESTRPKNVIAAERQKRAIALRIQNWTLTEIAQELGIKPSSVHYLIITGLKKLKAPEEAEQLRKVEAIRLDNLARGIWDQAIGGDLQAMDRLLKIMERRSKLLLLDKPEEAEKPQGFGYRPTSEVFAALMARMNKLADAKEFEATGHSSNGNGHKDGEPVR